MTNPSTPTNEPRALDHTIGAVEVVATPGLDIARLWDRSDNRLLEWLGQGPGGGSGACRIAAVLPSQEVTAEDHMVFQMFGIQPVVVPEEMASAPSGAVETYLLAELNE